MADLSSPTGPESPTGVQLIGATIAGRYKIESLLGSGGMGSVYMVQHTHMHKRFALKILNSEAAQVPEIEHPNITSAIDFGRAEDESFFLVLEYLEGQRLRDALAAGPLRWLKRRLAWRAPHLWKPSRCD